MINRNTIPKTNLERKLADNVLDLIGSYAKKDIIVHSYDMYYKFIKKQTEQNQPYNPNLFLKIVREYNLWNRDIKFRREFE